MMSEAWRGLTRPAQFFRSIWAGGEQRPACVAAASIPVALCVALLAAFALLAPGGWAWAEQALFFAFVAATWPAAAAAFWATGRLLGSRADFGAVLAGWGQSYWATAAFLLVLAATHLPFETPAALPDWVKAAAMTVYLGALLWKLLYAILTIRDLLGLSKWKALGAFVALGFLCGLFALLSAFAFGLKVPIV